MASGKNIEKARAAVSKSAYPLPEAVNLLKQVKYAKFDETVDLTMRLGVDTRHADQMVRGTVVLPHGLAKPGGTRPGPLRTTCRPLSAPSPTPGRVNRRSLQAQHLREAEPSYLAGRRPGQRVTTSYCLGRL